MIEITPELMLRAYAVGVFPMAETRHTDALFWLDPDKRGILPLDRMHVPRRLRRTVRSGKFEVTADQDFAGVIAACAESAPGRRDTWINAPLRELFTRLHEMGFAHSIECRREGRLVGGLYGLALGSAFFGESMFSREADASKVALVHLAARLAAGGYRLLDTQFINPHLARFGATEISRREYRAVLDIAVGEPRIFPVELPPKALAAFLDARAAHGTDDEAAKRR